MWRKITALVLILSALPSAVFASTIYFQPDFSTLFSGDGSINDTYLDYAQSLGGGLGATCFNASTLSSGILGTVAVKLYGNSFPTGSGYQTGLYVVGYSATNCGGSQSTLSGFSAPHQYLTHSCDGLTGECDITADFTSRAISLSSSYLSYSVSAYGWNVSAPAGGAGFYGSAGRLAYLYVDDTGSAPPTDFTTRIISVSSPANGATTAGTSVSFTFDYYYNDTTLPHYDKAGISLQDITGFQDINTPEENIMASGGSTYSETITLTSGHEYLWRPYLRNSATSTPATLSGDLYTFFVISNPYPLDLNTTGSTTVGSTTQSAINIYTGLFNAIKGNPPFGFIFAIISDLASTSPTSTPAVATLYIPDFERTYVFGVFDTGMAGLLFFVFTVWLFKRFVHFEL